MLSNLFCFRNFAKKTLLKTARKAGIKTKDYSGKRTPKFPSPTPPLNRRFMDYDYGGTLGTESQYAMFTDDLSGCFTHENFCIWCFCFFVYHFTFISPAVIDEQETKVQVLNDMKNFERLAERLYCKDFARLGFGSLHTPSAHPPIRPRPDQFRLALVNINSTYGVCPRFTIYLVFLFINNIVVKLCYYDVIVYCQCWMKCYFNCFDEVLKQFAGYHVSPANVANCILTSGVLHLYNKWMNEWTNDFCK